MNKEEVQQYLKSEEGSALLEEFKQPLISNRDAIKNDLVKAKEQLSALMTANEQRDAEAQRIKDEAEKEKLKSGGDFDAYKVFHEEQVKEYETKLSALKDQQANAEVSRLITETATKYSNTPKPLQLLLKERIEVGFNEGGSLQVKVIGDDGQPMYHDGQPATVDQLVNSLKSNEDYGAFFSASGSSGSGSTQSGDVPTGDYKDMSSDSFNLSKAMGNKL